MEIQDLLLTALRASLIYFFLLFVIRVLGKREVGASSAFDLIVALMLGEVVDEAIYGDVTMIKAIVAISVIALWHFVNSWASYRSKIVHRLTSSSPALMVESGKIVEKSLAQERMHKEELLSELRLLSIDDLKEVKEAYLEPSGKISVLKEDWAKSVQKGDVNLKGKK